MPHHLKLTTSALVIAAGVFSATNVSAGSEQLWNQLQSSGVTAEKVEITDNSVFLNRLSVPIGASLGGTTAIKIPQVTIVDSVSGAVIEFPEKFIVDVIDQSDNEVITQIALAHKGFTIGVPDGTDMVIEPTGDELTFSSIFSNQGDSVSISGTVSNFSGSLQNAIQTGVLSGKNNLVSDSYEIAVDVNGGQAVDVKAGDNTVNLDYSVALSPRFLRFVVGDLDLEAADQAALLKEFVSKVVIDLNADTSDIAQVQPVVDAQNNGLGVLSSTIKNAKNIMTMKDGNFLVRTSATEFDGVFESVNPSIPLDTVAASFDEIGFGMNASMLGEEFTGRMVYALGGFELAEEAWATLDPSGVLDKEPMSFVMDASASLPSEAIWSGNPNAIPEISLKMNNLDVSALGANVKGKADVLVKDQVPQGFANVLFENLMPTIDQISEAGFIPGGQAIQAKGLLSMFARGTEDGNLELDFQFEESGSILLNDMPIQ